MAKPHKRETFIALRARRTAYQVATGIMFPKIRRGRVRLRCSRCMSYLDPTRADGQMKLQCPRCGEWVEIPEDVAAELGSTRPGPDGPSPIKLQDERLEATGVFLRDLIPIVVWFVGPVLVCIVLLQVLGC